MLPDNSGDLSGRKTNGSDVEVRHVPSFSTPTSSVGEGREVPIHIRLDRRKSVGLFQLTFL